MGDIRKIVRASAVFSLVLLLSAFLVMMYRANSVYADPTYTFSGILSDQNGTILKSVTVNLRDASGSHSYNTTTATNGSFSLTVAPGTYALKLSTASYGVVPGVDSFTLSQPAAAPSIDLTSSNVTQNLALQIATVSATLYNAQDYLNSNGRVTYGNASGTASLYAGDPGEAIWTSGDNWNATSGTASFKTIVGATYTAASGSTGLCDYSFGGSTVYGCITYTAANATNTVDLPHTPAPRNTFSGTLKDQTGASLHGVAVKLTDQFGNGPSATTATDGSFSLSAEPGLYALKLSTASYGVVSGVDSFTLTQSTATPSIDLTTDNVTQNLALQIATVNTTLYNSQGLLNTNGRLTYTNASGSASLYASDPGETIWTSGDNWNATNGLVTFKAVVGSIYVATGSSTGFCDYGHNGSPLYGCVTYSVVNGANHVTLVPFPAPTGLAATSPTTEPSLSWTAVTGATTYKVYRDGTVIGMASGTTYVDNNVAPGAHTYSVAAGSSVGFGSQSNTINVTVNATVPTLDTVSFSANPVFKGQSTTVTVHVTGNLYGFLRGEYYVGDTDPGPGNGTVMAYGNGVLTALISDLPVGTQSINIRAQNSTGWSMVASSNLSVVLPTFSGTLTDQNGTALGNVNINLHNTVPLSYSVTTAADGSFSLSAEPGVYSLKLSTASYDIVPGIDSFTLAQSNTAPGIDLTIGNVTQNLKLQTTTVTATLYNAHDYSNQNGKIVHGNAFGSMSLYTGDPGETIWTSGDSWTTTNGVVSFKTIVGATYATAPGNTGICDYNHDGSTLYGCIDYTAINGTNAIDLPHSPAPRNTFSGTLTDQNGTSLPGVLVKLTDQFGDSSSDTTSSTGNYSLAVEPGMYALSLTTDNYGVVPGVDSFRLNQSATTPSIDLTSGNMTQNLALQIATVNTTLYNSQELLNTNGKLNHGNASGTAVLYTGDPGETIWTSGDNWNASSGMVSFKTIVGAVYTVVPGNTGICDYNHDGSTLYGCISYTVVNSTNTLALVTPPAPTGLTATSPTSEPSLSWIAVGGATSYDVYRDDAKIGTMNGTAYADTAALSGNTYDYYVKAVDDAGSTSSSSNTVSVSVE